MTTTIKLGKLDLVEIYFSVKEKNNEVYNLDVGRRIHDKLQKLFMKNKKRIYKNKVYYHENLCLDVHRNGLFYYSECYELIPKNTEELTTKNVKVVVNKYTKNIQPSDNFPIIKNYLLETERNVIEYLTGENHLVLLCEQNGKYWVKLHTYTEKNLDHLIRLIVENL